MYKISVLSIFMLCVCFLFAQNKDLIVTQNGDSIACEIIELKDSVVIVKMKYANRKTQTMQNLDEIKDIKYDVVQKGMYRYKPGTSYIIGYKYQISSKTYTLDYLRNASPEELNYYYYKAGKLQKIGRIMNIGGISTFGVSAICAFATSDSWGLGALIFIFPALAGLGTLLVGLPVNLTGKYRIDQVNSVRNTAFNDIGINLQPCAQYNILSQNFQPGITLKISF